MDNAKHYDDASIALIESRCKSNTHRINELQEHQTALDRLATSVEVLATKQETVEGDVKEIKEDVKAITGKPGKRWDSLVDKALAALAGVWGWGYVEQVTTTISAVALFIGALIGVSSANYKKEHGDVSQ